MRVYVIELKNCISAGTSAYLLSGPVVSGISANYYYALDISGLVTGEQSVSPLTGETTFPDLSFSTIDGKKDSPTDTGDITYLLTTYRNNIYQNQVILWEGDDVTAFGSFTKCYTGYVSNITRESGGYSWQTASLFSRMEWPISFRTGSFQIATADIDYGDRQAEIYKSVNLTTQTRTNFIDTTLANWTVDAGTYDNPGGPTRIRPTTNGVCTMHRDINQGTGANNIKYGAVYSFFFNYSGKSLGDPDTTITITVQGYNGASLIDTWTQVVTRSQIFATVRSAGIMYPVTNSSLTKIRVTISEDMSAATVPGGYYKNLTVGVSNPWMLEREIIDIDTYDSSTGKIEIAVRGGLGSYPSAHKVDAEAKALTIWAGHPLDIWRRGLTTTAAGTNGSFDVGDGYGLGSLIDSSLLSSNISTERNLTDSGSAFSGYDYSAYRMVFLFTEKIENFKQWAEAEIFKPIHGNMLVDANGLLDCKLWKPSETAGSNTLTDSTIIATEEIPFDYSRDECVNQIVYRMDFDPNGACDVQGTQKGGSNSYLREWTYRESSFGEDSTTAASYAILGTREMTIESQGLRGAHMTRFGYLAAFGGDQTSFEVSRRIMTRHRWPIQVYSVDAAWSARNYKVGEIINVTCSVMLDLAAGSWGRTTKAMAIVGKEVDYDAEIVRLKLHAVCDFTAIPNTTTAGAVSAPVDADITAVAKAASLAAEQRQDYPIYPKGFSNVVQITVAGSPSDGDAAETLIYAFVGNTTAGPSSDADYQLVGEVASGSTAFYLCVIGQSSGSTYLWVKAKFRNADRVSSSFGPLEPGGTYATIDSGADHGNRGSKSEIKQVASTRGETSSWAPTSMWR